MTYGHGKKAQGNSSGFVLAIILLAGGALLFWRLKASFQSAAAVKKLDVAAAAPGLVTVTGQPFVSVALKSLTDDRETGRVERTLGEVSASYRVVTVLPALGEGEVYRAWLLKKGLANVVSLGVMTPRADGGFGLEYTASPATGVDEPMAYTSLVITREARATDGKPTGNVIVKAIFE